MCERRGGNTRQEGEVEMVIEEKAGERPSMTESWGKRRKGEEGSTKTREMSLRFKYETESWLTIYCSPV